MAQIPAERELPEQNRESRFCSFHRRKKKSSCFFRRKTRFLRYKKGVPCPKKAHTKKEAFALMRGANARCNNARTKKTPCAKKGPPPSPPFFGNPGSQFSGFQHKPEAKPEGGHNKKERGRNAGGGGSMAGNPPVFMPICPALVLLFLCAAPFFSPGWAKKYWGL